MIADWLICIKGKPLFLVNVKIFTLFCILQVLLGLSYSLLACALWPMVAFVVPEHQLGTAYGL